MKIRIIEKEQCDNSIIITFESIFGKAKARWIGDDTEGVDYIIELEPIDCVCSTETTAPSPFLETFGDGLSGRLGGVLEDPFEPPMLLVRLDTLVLQVECLRLDHVIGNIVEVHFRELHVYNVNI